MKVCDPKHLEGAPESFKSVDAKGKDMKGLKFTLQVSPEDCTGCGSCNFRCPAMKKDSEGNKDPNHKAINMELQEPLREQEAENYAFFLNLPETDPSLINLKTVKGSQLVRPLFEYSGACSGCGETPSIRLLTQLFGDRLLIGNATGCSSIYGGNLPTTPYARRADGRGPSWSNSLFEDNAEFALGMRQTVDKFNAQALELLVTLGSRKELAGAAELFRSLREADQSEQAGIELQRGRVEELKKVLVAEGSPEAKHLISLADYLVKKSVWAVGGDGWAYDIGYGGLDHTLGIGRNVNLLVLDTGVYSNTGGQASKATPLGAVAKFAMGGKEIPSKDLGMMAMAYGHVYVASVAFGAKDSQTVRAFLEAESYEGPSIIIAYSHCIAHGYNMSDALDHQKAVVECGAWPMYRFDPRRTAMGENPLKLDSRAPKILFDEWALSETRFRMLAKINPERSKRLLEEAQRVVQAKYDMYQQLANLHYGSDADAETN
jgi:pyruvate-ferredoxin/flavodoxin oxidoreductase